MPDNLFSPISRFMPYTLPLKPRKRYPQKGSATEPGAFRLPHRSGGKISATGPGIQRNGRAKLFVQTRARKNAGPGKTPPGNAITNLSARQRLVGKQNKHHRLILNQAQKEKHKTLFRNSV